MNSMRTIQFILLISVITLFTTSCNKDIIKMEVIKDCSGVYLEKNGVEHKVCNESIFDSYATGDKVKVSYDVLEQCFGLQEDPACSTTHSYLDLIDVYKIH